MKFGVKCTTLFPSSRIDWQLCNKIAKFVANFRNHLSKILWQTARHLRGWGQNNSSFQSLKQSNCWSSTTCQQSWIKCSDSFMVKNTGSHLCFQHTYVPTSTYHTQPGLNSKKGQVELLAVLQSQTELNFAGKPAVNTIGTYRRWQQLATIALKYQKRVPGHAGCYVTVHNLLSCKSSFSNYAINKRINYAIFRYFDGSLIYNVEMNMYT